MLYNLQVEDIVRHKLHRGGFKFYKQTKGQGILVSHCFQFASVLIKNNLLHLIVFPKIQRSSSFV